ncbi:NINE protein [Virgibacillus salexigens]|uniref:TM2 domain-containing protein n=1 Tax=Virgibacillus massiliensis TaxID=1462526 RepID=A0A024QH92_9BACI|nr:NINE protein [Virgibacillus massiliensis]CDQ41918.1 TM2 domain-containing protein [Virgibacillus massiliensis]
MQNLNTQEKIYVNSEIEKRGKSILLSYLLLIFLGPLGIHRFYLGRVGTAITLLSLFLIGLITSWLLIGFIPLAVVGVWILVDLFLVPGIVRTLNEKLEQQIIKELKG